MNYKAHITRSEDYVNNMEFIVCAKKLKRYETVKNYIDSMLEDFITPELRKVMEEHGLFIRRITQ